MFSPNFSDNQKVNDFFSNITSVLIDKATEKFIKVAEPPKGNLTADQVADGQRGQIQGLPAPQDNSKKIGMFMIIGAAILAVLLIFKKR